MVLSGQKAVRRTSDCPPAFLLYFLLLISIVPPNVCAQIAQAGQGTTTLDDAARQLADRVVAIPNLRGPLRVQYFQEASLAAETGKDWQETFRKGLERSRLAVTEDTGANLLRVGLAETPTEVVLSAGVRINDREEVRFVTMARATFAIPKATVSPIRIDQQLVYQSGDRILDAAYFVDGPEKNLMILVNSPGGLAVLRIGSGGEIKQAVSLGAAGAHAERANDGELQFEGSEVSVAFAGRACHFAWTVSQDVSCRAGKVMRRGTALLKPACGPGAWKLIADGTDWFSPEFLQVVPDGNAGKASAALLSDFPGPILSVNASGERGPDGALVVTRNLRTGNYEVYKITLACGN